MLPCVLVGMLSRIISAYVYHLVDVFSSGHHLETKVSMTSKTVSASSAHEAARAAWARVGGTGMVEVVAQTGECMTHVA